MVVCGLFDTREEVPAFSHPTKWPLNAGEGPLSRVIRGQFGGKSPAFLRISTVCGGKGRSNSPSRLKLRRHSRNGIKFANFIQGVSLF
jgi:hypothetical protein